MMKFKFLSISLRLLSFLAMMTFGSMAFAVEPVHPDPPVSISKSFEGIDYGYTLEVTGASEAAGTAMDHDNKIYVEKDKEYTFKLAVTEDSNWYIGIQPTQDDGITLDYDKRNGSRDGAGPNTTYIYITNTFNTCGAHSIAKGLYFKGADFQHSEMNPVEVEVYTPKVDIEYNSLPEETQSTPHEEDPGGFICINDNDDDGVVGVDMDRATTEPELAAADPNLKEVKLSLTPVLDTGVVTLTVPSELRVWENAKKKSLITGPWNLATPSEKTAFEALLSGNVWVEGIATGDGELKLSYDGTCEDKVKMTTIKVDFKARARMITYGFDPKEIVQTGGPYAWASVDKDDASDVPKIDIVPSTAADEIELVVVSGGSSADVTPKTFTVESTDLTITGQGTAGNAVVEARVGSTGPACEKLNIMALPKQTLTVGIYYIKDSSSAGTFPVGGPLANSVIDTLNDVFKQARIDFTLEETATVDKPYDSSGHGIDGDGKFQAGEVTELNVTGADWKGDLKMFFIKSSGITYEVTPPFNAYYIRGAALLTVS